MNEKLISPFDDRERKDALFQMYPLKAPIPNGFPAQFLQKHWDLYGVDVTPVVLQILRGEDSPKGINKTFIILIPKVASPEELGQFRQLAYAMSFIKLHQKFWQTGARLFFQKSSLRNSQPLSQGG
jgi:hypothetical protein